MGSLIWFSGLYVMSKLCPCVLNDRTGQLNKHCSNCSHSRADATMNHISCRLAFRPERIVRGAFRRITWFWKNSNPTGNTLTMFSITRMTQVSISNGLGLDKKIRPTNGQGERKPTIFSYVTPAGLSGNQPSKWCCESTPHAQLP